MAAWTLSEIAYRVLREITNVVEGIATGGATTTIIDSVRLLGQFPDDAFKYGTAFVIRDSAGLGAAPEKEYSRISAFTSSSGTATFAAMTTAVAAGDRYAIASKQYDLDRVIGAINAALLRIKVVTEDTSLDTAADQLEYTLPTGISDEGIEILLQGRTDDADSNNWTPVYNWYISETGTGVAKKLVFYSQPAEN